MTRLIIQNAILPRFRAGDFAGGIARGVDDIIQVVSGDAEDFKRRAAQRPDAQPQGHQYRQPDHLRLIVLFVDLHDAAQAGRRARTSAARRLCGPDLHSIGRLLVVRLVRRQQRRRLFGRRRLVRRRRRLGRLVNAVRRRIAHASSKPFAQPRCARPAKSTAWSRAPASGYRVFPLAYAATHRAAGAAAADPVDRLARNGHLSSLQLVGLSGRPLSRDARAHPLSPGAAHGRGASARIRKRCASSAHTACSIRELRTGVLIFVSFAERYAEVIADAGIDQKVSPRRLAANVSKSLLADIAAGRTPTASSPPSKIAPTFLRSIFRPARSIATNCRTRSSSCGR